MRVAVVGGGIGGLAAALRLVQAGHDVAVLDGGARPGGVIGTSTAEGFRREHAANGFLTGADAGAAALCDELGVRVVEAAPAARARWIYLRGRLHRLPAGPGSFARSGLLSWRGKLALLGEPLRPARDGHRGRRRVAVGLRGAPPRHRGRPVPGRADGDRRVRRRRAPGQPGGRVPRLAALDARGGLVRGMIAEARGRRRGGGARRRGKTTLAAPAGGMAVLVDALAARLGDRVRRGVTVRGLEPAHAAWSWSATIRRGASAPRRRRAGGAGAHGGGGAGARRLARPGPRPDRARVRAGGPGLPRLPRPRRPRRRRRLRLPGGAGLRRRGSWAALIERTVWPSARRPITCCSA
ncbi:MAG: FAD-dependent oxidoreductase [Kofleriaceae bacterium]|nr:FAD-dependent oxidoreductase [Kofleriaceae bacterium]